MPEEEKPWWTQFLDEEDEAEAPKDKGVSTRIINGTSYRLYERPDGSLYTKNLSTGEATDGGFPAVESKTTTAASKSSGGTSSTASSGSSSAPRASSGGGGGAAAAAKPDDPGASFSIKGADGTANVWREYTRSDGSTYYKNLNSGDVSERLPTSAPPPPPPKKLSPLEISANNLKAANGTLAGGEGSAASASGQGVASSAGAPAPAGEPRTMTADNGTRLTGLDMPGYGTLNTVGTGGNNVTAILQAAHVKPTGDPQMDLRTVLGILGKREVALAGGLSPTEYQSQVDQLAYSRAKPYGGGMPHYDAPVSSVSTPTVNASGKIVIDDTPGHYRELLEPQSEDPYSYMANGTPDFNTPNPIAFVDMVTGQPIGMAGGTGRETISVDPDGPHGTPAQEAQVGSRMWPGMMGVPMHANGTDDDVDYSSVNGGRDPDYISASMLGLNTSSGEPGGVSAPDGAGQRQVASWNREFKPTLSPEEIYLQRKAQGWAGNSTFLNDEPETNDDWLRYVQTHLNDPMTRLPARLLPKQFLQDPAITRARKIALNPEYYGYTDQYMAGGGTVYAGTDDDQMGDQNSWNRGYSGDYDRYITPEQFYELYGRYPPNYQPPFYPPNDADQMGDQAAWNRGYSGDYNGYPTTQQFEELYGQPPRGFANGGSGTAGDDDMGMQNASNQGMIRYEDGSISWPRPWDFAPQGPAGYPFVSPAYGSPQTAPFNPNARLDPSQVGYASPYDPMWTQPRPSPHPVPAYADGGSGYTGHPGNADGGGFSNLERVFQLQDLDNAGVFGMARAGWESGLMTPAMQQRLWATQAIPGNGNPINGNHFLPGLTYSGLWGLPGGGLPLASLYNTNAAQLTTDSYRELGNQVNPNATRSLGLEAPKTPQQIMNTPIKTLMTQGAGANMPQAVTMADGGVVDVNPYDIQLGREAPYYNAQTPVPLVDPVRVLQGLRKKVAA